MHRHRAGLVDDDGIRIGKFRDLIGDAVGDQRAHIPFRIVRDQCPQGAGLLAEFLHLCGALGSFGLERRRHQLLDRNVKIV